MMGDRDQTALKPVKNILLIGRTGAGKSTTANVLVNKNGNFKEIFKESAGSTSQTKDYKVEEVVMSGNTYRIIDTIGIGDTSLSEQETLYNLGTVAQELKGGINQIFFVGDGRFTEVEIKAFGILGLVLFDKEADNYTSIIRTRFPKFADQKSCEDDIQLLEGDSSDLKTLVESIGKRIIYIDAPEREYLDIPKVQEKWKTSSERLWTFLGTCQHINYRPRNLENINRRIDNHIKENDRIEEFKKLISANDNNEKLRQLERLLDGERKKVIANAVNEHERTLYENLRINYAKSIEQGIEIGEKLPLPFGTGKLLGATVGGTVGLLGGSASALAHLVRGMK